METESILDQEISNQETSEEMCDLCVLDDSGHSRMQWNKNDRAQVAAARARFDELKAKNFLAYKVDAGGGPGEVLHKFDPKAERIIMQRQMVGG